MLGDGHILEDHPGEITGRDKEWISHKEIYGA